MATPQEQETESPTRQTVREMLADGYSVRDIAESLGVSTQRVYTIRKSLELVQQK